MKKSLFVLFSITMLGCSEVTVNDMLWIEGKWTRTYSSTTNTQVWMLKKDTLIGESIFQTEWDTSTLQMTKIYRDNQGLKLELHAPENPYPMKYELLHLEESFVQFRNIQPFFPEIISYKLENDSLVAGLIGKTQGMNNNVEFYYFKMP